MEPQSLLPKAFLDLFEFKFNQIFSEEQLRELDKLPLNIRDTLNDFIRDIQLKHESTREDFLRKKDAYGLLNCNFINMVTFLQYLCFNDFRANGVRT